MKSTNITVMVYLKSNKRKDYHYSDNKKAQEQVNFMRKRSDVKSAYLIN